MAILFFENLFHRSGGSTGINGLNCTLVSASSSGHSQLLHRQQNMWLSEKLAEERYIPMPASITASATFGHSV